MKLKQNMWYMKGNHTFPYPISFDPPLTKKVCCRFIDKKKLDFFLLSNDTARSTAQRSVITVKKTITAGSDPRRRRVRRG